MKNQKIFNICISAMLIAICIIGRNLCSSLPNIQPVTAIIILSTIFFSLTISLPIAVGTMIITGCILGFGIWIPFQILAYVVICVLCKLLLKRPNLLMMCVFGVLSAYVYGFITNLSMLFFIDGGLWAICISSIPFDTYHAVGNVIFIAMFYKVFQIMSSKYFKTTQNN